MKTFQKRWIVLFSLFLLHSSHDVWAQQAPLDEAKEVVATGMGSILGNDIAHARDDAIKDALRKGVENALGLIVESETLVENYQLIEDKIFSKTQGYVQKYQIIQEGKQSEQLYEVTVNATVKMTDLKNDLEGIATLMRRVNRPRMMVIIQEQNIGEAPGLFGYFEADMNTAETAIMEAFMAKGFKFIDHETVKQNLKNEQATAIMEGDVAKAAALGRSVGAEVVITGKALAKATVVEAFGTTTRSQQATITVRAIRTDTGDIIATQSGQGAYPHIDDAVGGAKAIQLACKSLSENLMNEILDQWQKDISEGSTITLQIEGVSDYSQLTKFKYALEYYVRGISSVIQRDWHEGFATLEIVMTGNSEDLANGLSGKEIEGIDVKVIGMSQNSVTVKFVQGD